MLSLRAFCIVLLNGCLPPKMQFSLQNSQLLSMGWAQINPVAHEHAQYHQFSEKWLRK